MPVHLLFFYYYYGNNILLSKPSFRSVTPSRIVVRDDDQAGAESITSSNTGSGVNLSIPVKTGIQPWLSLSF